MICRCEYLTRGGHGAADYAAAGHAEGGHAAADYAAAGHAEGGHAAADYVAAGGMHVPENAYGVRILECRSLDSLAVLPDEINGLPVLELAPYLFSVHGEHKDGAAAGTFWWPETEAADSPPARLPNRQPDRLPNRPPARLPDRLPDSPPGSLSDLPSLSGNRLEELRLPARLEKVGAYALYNCEKLRKLELSSTTLDWGAGVFAGCYGVEQVTIHVDESRRSCMREVLAELRQTLEVLYLPVKTADGEGAQLRENYGQNGVVPPPSLPAARLIFPEFFEEAVENTPARILVTETHGCGQKYRNAFVSTQFQFKEYDSLFPHIQVQESEKLTARLALGRLMAPYRLEERYAGRYLEYLREHATAAAGWAVECGDMPALEWIFSHIPCDGEMISALLNIAGARENGVAVSFLMDRRRAAGAVKRKHFSL